MLAKPVPNEEELMDQSDATGVGEPVLTPLVRQGRPSPAASVLLGSAFALGAGLAIAWMDSRPHWDDTAVTVAAVVIATGLAGLLRLPPWLAALLVTGPMLVVELPGGMGVLLALPFALAGAYGGAMVRRYSMVA